MPTIDDYNFVKALIDNEGVYEDDPVVRAIFEYINDAGKITWSVCYTNFDIQCLLMSDYVHVPKLIWSVSSGKVNDMTIES